MPIHHRTPTSPARGSQPAGHRLSHIGCTHSFRTNGGYTDARIDRLRTAATRRMGADTTARSVRWERLGWPCALASHGDDRRQPPVPKAHRGRSGCWRDPTANRSSASYCVLLGRVSKQQREFGRFPQSPMSRPARRNGLAALPLLELSRHMAALAARRPRSGHWPSWPRERRSGDLTGRAKVAAFRVVLANQATRG